MSSQEVVVLALLIVAVIISAVEEVRAKGQNYLAWACIVGFGALVLDRLLA